VKFGLIAGFASKPQEFQPRGGDVKLFGVARVLITLSGVDFCDCGSTIVKKHMVIAREAAYKCFASISGLRFETTISFLDQGFTRL
jgi:hypothetical protein